jgi:hypothetical protein
LEYFFSESSLFEFIIEFKMPLNSLRRVVNVSCDCPPSIYPNVFLLAEDLKEQFEKNTQYPAFNYALKVYQDLRGNDK